MRKLLFTLPVLLMTMACTQKTAQENPFFAQEYDTPFGVPPFEKIEAAHYMPAFDQGMKEQNQEIEAITSNPETPTFANTIEALDASGALLNRVASVFFNLTSAETNEELQTIAQELSPLMSEHGDNISLNAALFNRIKAVHDHYATPSANEEQSTPLTTEQKSLLDKYYKDYVRSGALLSDSDKEILKGINKELSMLSLKFGDNLLAENNNFKITITDPAQLAGLPQWAIDAAAEVAGTPNTWVFTLKMPSYIPFMQYADSRELREKMYKGYTNRANNNDEYDNKANVAAMVNLRLRKAKLLGYNTYADYILEDRMAKNTEQVNSLLDRVWGYALDKAKAERAELQKMVNTEGGKFKLEAWDWNYYTEKLRKAKYDLDEEELKPYFKLENVRDGVFMVANKLYGITFTQLHDMPVYHTDVTAYEVKDSDGSHLGILYLDYFPRAGKRGGAWMSNFREQYIEDGKDIRPVIYNVGNFTAPSGDLPSLLTADEVLTLFHEFGHAMHGMLSKCQYVTTSGTNVTRDFVELPSQIMEHWALEPEVLKFYAKHYLTGEDMPLELVEKLDKSSKFNQGFATTEFVAAAILDMKWHEVSEEQDFDVTAFEKAATTDMGLIPEIATRYRSTYFSHIFSGGYAVGYYSYLWAEVLDADAFDAFKEHGLFDTATATAFRTNVLEKGGSDDAMTLYLNFRGAAPNPQSLLHNRGLIE